MLRLLLLSLAVSATLLPPKASFAALSLIDTNAGYSITLPEGWERMPPYVAIKKSKEIGEIVPIPIPEDSSIRMDVQGAILRQPEGEESQELLILSAPNRAFGLDAAILEKPTTRNAALNELETGLHSALLLSGMAIKSKVMLEDGLRLSYSPDASAERTLHWIMEFRFSTSHTIVAILSRTMEDATGAPASILPDTLAIAEDKRLGLEGKRKFTESISSLLAIAGILLMVLVMRRRRAQLLKQK